MFVGRMDEIRTIERYLFQAKSGNPQNFLIDGERGIGKSSLMHYVSAIATGKIPGEKGQQFNFLLLSVDMGGVVRQLDIVRAIARELKSSIARTQDLKERAKNLWDFLSAWEVLGVRYHKEAEGWDPEDAKDTLVDQLVAFAQAGYGGFDGVLVVIDEADAPPLEASFGEFLKSITERLNRHGCENIIFGLAGLTSTITKLRASHESSPRIFSILHLEPLSNDERYQAINIGIKIANERNVDKTLISGGAMEMVSELSEGYPHFIQQFSYSAFEADKDFQVDADDVRQGAYGENGAIHQLGRKYFAEAYFGKINSEDYRKLLDVMAEHGDNWVTRRQLIFESRLKEHTVNNALAALKAKSIILVDEGRQGHYRLPTRSFAAWINAVKAAARKNAPSGASQLVFEVDFSSSDVGTDVRG